MKTKSMTAVFRITVVASSLALIVLSVLGKTRLGSVIFLGSLLSVLLFIFIVIGHKVEMESRKDECSILPVLDKEEEP